MSEVDWKIEPLRCSGPLQRAGVGDVAVVGDREAAAGELGEQRLDVAERRRRPSSNSGCGRWRASPGSRSITDGLVKLSPTRPMWRSLAELRAVEGDDAGRLLAAVLQRVQAQRGERRRPPDDRRCRKRRTPRGACRRRRGEAANPACSSPQLGGSACICCSSAFWSSGASPGSGILGRRNIERRRRLARKRLLGGWRRRLVRRRRGTAPGSPLPDPPAAC